MSNTHLSGNGDQSLTKKNDGSLTVMTKVNKSHELTLTTQASSYVDQAIKTDKQEPHKDIMTLSKGNSY